MKTIVVFGAQIPVYAWGPNERLIVLTAMKPTLLCSILVAAPLLAQSPCPENQNWGNPDRGSHCEVRQYTLAPTGRLSVDSSTNGGIRVIGTDRADVLVRARVNTNAATPDQARALAASVRVDATPGIIRASGPTPGERGQGWAVSYEIEVPRRSGLDLKAHNGGINISDVDGDIQFDTQNGGVKLERLSGDVKGRTVNGGLNVALAGNTWRGNQLDVQTTNGGINVSVPDGYSARFETSTVNGRVKSEVPGANIIKGQNDRTTAITLGSGGPLVRLTTTNGGVNLKRT
jgi:hypothetical protein